MHQPIDIQLLKIYKLTKECAPGLFQRVLLWRKDSKRWEINDVNFDHIGNPEYAYTHWAYKPTPVED